MVNICNNGKPEEGVQAYGGLYSSVTYSGNIRNEIGVLRFPCNEIAMSDSFEKQNLAPTVPKTVHANDVSLEMCIYFWWSRVCTALETVGCAPVFV